MLIYDLKPQLHAYGPHRRVMQLCFRFYLGESINPSSSEIPLHDNDGGTKAQEFMATMLPYARGHT